MSDWRQTGHDGLVYEGEDAGCVSVTIWEEDALEIRISGDDVGLDRDGVERLVRIFLRDINAQIIEAGKEPAT